jgi:phosphopantetheinyl transferase (holo-ACP synthase)
MTILGLSLPSHTAQKVEVVSTGDGPPSFAFHSDSWRNATRTLSFHLSLSHESNMCVAICIATLQ